MRIRRLNNTGPAAVGSRAFTMTELLIVIAIMGLVAALAAPVFKNFKRGDTVGSATRQMLDAVAAARQMAISQRTTVYLVFAPSNFWTADGVRQRILQLPAPPPAFTLQELTAASNVAALQLTGYNFATLRSLGDQPGHPTAKYLSTWQPLPENVFIAIDKFRFNNLNYIPAFFQNTGFKIYGFDITTDIPFPLEETTPWFRQLQYAPLPYIAFNYLGQLTTESLSPKPLQRDCFIPLAHGSVLVQKDPNKVPSLSGFTSVSESPSYNSLSNYNIIHIDWLTGRGRLERREVQ